MASSSDEEDLSYNPFETNGCRSLHLVAGRAHSCGSLVKLYARMGLHRYNLVEGKNYEFISVKKYNYRAPLPITSYFITVVAKNREDGSKMEFHTKIDEKTRSMLLLTCYVSRFRRDDPRKGSPLIYKFDYTSVTLPAWPRENPFKNTELYYLLTKSQLEDNDWIRMYLELAVASNDRRSTDHDLSKLEIMKVAARHEEDLSATNATFYIHYEDPDTTRVGKFKYRIAIVQRAFDKATKCFSLVGHNMSSDIIRIHELLSPEEDSVPVEKETVTAVLGSVEASSSGIQKQKGSMAKKKRVAKKVKKDDSSVRKENVTANPCLSESKQEKAGEACTEVPANSTLSMRKLKAKAKLIRCDQLEQHSVQENINSLVDGNKQKINGAEKFNASGEEVNNTTTTQKGDLPKTLANNNKIGRKRKRGKQVLRV